jgi:hypothetical protein
VAAVRRASHLYITNHRGDCGCNSAARETTPSGLAPTTNRTARRGRHFQPKGYFMTGKQHDVPEDEPKQDNQNKPKQPNAEVDPLGSFGPGFIPGEGI